MGSAFEHPEIPRLGTRFVAFGVIAALFFTVIAGRLFQLQVVEGAVRAEQAEAAHAVDVAIPAERGLVFDRAGRPLVVNVPTWTVAVRPADLPDIRRTAVIRRVAAVTGIPAADLQARLDAFSGSPFDLVPLADDVPREAALVLAEEAAALPGVEMQVIPRRQYLNERGQVDGTLMSHVVGYTGPINGEELETLADEGYLHDDPIGRTGVEASFEDLLRGEYGSARWERDATGRLVKVIEETSQPVAGSNLVLTKRALYVLGSACCWHRPSPTRPGADAHLVHELGRPQHLHRHCRHLRRPWLRQWPEDAGRRPVPVGRRRDHDPARDRDVDCPSLFRFHDALTLGIVSGSRTATASLGLVCDPAESQVPALGYTVTYAVGNTLLTLWRQCGGQGPCAAVGEAG